jgi:hypothetical protein
MADSFLGNDSLVSREEGIHHYYRGCEGSRGKFSGSKGKSDHQGSSHQGRVPLYDETNIIDLPMFRIPYISDCSEVLLLLLLILLES